jgi:hypothetical protein
MGPCAPLEGQLVRGARIAVIVKSMLCLAAHVTVDAWAHRPFFLCADSFPVSCSWHGFPIDVCARGLLNPCFFLHCAVCGCCLSAFRLVLILRGCSLPLLRLSWPVVLGRPCSMRVPLGFLLAFLSHPAFALQVTVDCNCPLDSLAMGGPATHYMFTRLRARQAIPQKRFRTRLVRNTE